MFFLKTLTGLRISKRAGWHTEMAVDWKHYISVVTEKLKVFLPLGCGQELITSAVSEERKVAAGLVETLRFKEGGDVYFGVEGFLVFLCAEDKKYAAVFRRDIESASDLCAAVGEFSKRHNMPCLEFTDAHFLFLIDSLDLPLRTSLDVAVLKGSVDLSNNKRAVLDFDIAKRCYGDIFVWELVPGFDERMLLELLICTPAGELNLSWMAKSFDFGFKRAVGVFSNVFDIGKLCKSLVRPVEAATDLIVESASIGLSRVEYLVSALKNYNMPEQDVVFGVGGGVCFAFEGGGRKFIALSLRNFHDDEIHKICSQMAELKAYEENLTIECVLSFFYNFDGLFDLSPGYLNQPKRIVDELDLSEMFKVDFKDLFRLYEDLRIFDISNAVDLSPWKVLCHLAVRFRRARSAFIPDSIASLAHRLSDLSYVPHENIYLSLSASHWKHSFLEVYRVVEGLYYFGWMHSLKKALKSTLTEHELSQQCKESAAWAHKEKASISKLFELVPVVAMEACNPSEISCVKEKLKGKQGDEFMRALSGVIYSIRNSNVHQGAHATDEFIEITAGCWPKLTGCLFLVAEYFYCNYSSGMPGRDDV